MRNVVPLSLMSQHLGHEVNVILHDGTSYWRRLTGIATGEIELSTLQDTKGLYPLTVKQSDIRSFGTRESGILVEV